MKGYIEVSKRVYCPKCNSENVMIENTGLLYCSKPAKYDLKCQDCGHVYVGATTQLKKEEDVD